MRCAACLRPARAAALCSSLLAGVAATAGGGPTVVLTVPPTSCGTPSCTQPPCIRSQWIGNGVLQVHATVMHGATWTVVPDSGTVALDDGVLRLGYGLRARHHDTGPGSLPPPACLVEVPLHFAVSGLDPRDYPVHVSEDLLYPYRPMAAAAGAGAAGLLAGWVAFRVMRRRLQQAHRVDG